MTTKLYLDKRRPAGGTEPSDGRWPVKVAVNHRSSSAYIATGIRVRAECWDARAEKVCGLDKQEKARLNLKLSEKKLRIDTVIEGLRLAGELHGATASEIKRAVERRIREEEEGRRGREWTVAECFEAFIAGKAKKKEGRRTAEVYGRTLKKLRGYEGFSEGMEFGEVTVGWLEDFETYLAETMPSANARGIHLRNVRAVFNDALTEGRTAAPYPFKRFKIRTEPTKDRSIEKEKLLAFFGAPCSPSQEKYRDVFKLSFLMCGINVEDLIELRESDSDRIDILRIKTGQPLNMKIQPEARKIIDKYRGTGGVYLLDIGEKWHNYADYLSLLNKNLKKIGKTYNPHTKEWEGEAVIPEISYYYARYSWATIAAELDVPERTVGYALGHGTSRSVTSIYTRVDMRKKIDEANRKVIDYVFGRKNLEGQK